MPRRKRKHGIPRKIYFYRLAHQGEVLEVLPGELERILNLPFADEGRYFIDGEDDRLWVQPDSVTYPLKLRFGRTRRTNLPTKELAGKLEALDLAVNQGLAEICHIIIYEDGFVAAEFNFDGPRISRLGDYLYAKRHRLKTRPSFLPLFQKNIVEIVKSMPIINILELQGHPNAGSLLARADENLAQAYDTIGSLGATKSITLGLAARDNPESKLKQLIVKLAALMNSPEHHARDEMKKLRIRGITVEGRTDWVDLLEDHLIAPKEFERAQPNSKAVDTEAAYAQINAAFDERRDLLMDAVHGRNLG
jgi:hypothetical protein